MSRFSTVWAPDKPVWDWLCDPDDDRLYTTVSMNFTVSIYTVVAQYLHELGGPWQVPGNANTLFLLVLDSKYHFTSLLIGTTVKSISCAI